MDYPALMVCGDCKEAKAQTDFLAYKAKGKEYRKRICKSCYSDRNKDWFKTNQAYRRRYDVRRRNGRRAYAHGITLEQFEAILKRQSGKCPICLKDLDINSRFTHVDHDHKTGRVRGALCHWCNVALGHFKDNPAALKRAYNYLRAHGPNLDLFIKYSPYDKNIHEDAINALGENKL